MKGFFYQPDEEAPRKSKPIGRRRATKRRSPAAATENMTSQQICEACGLFKGPHGPIQSPGMKGTGEGKLKILIIGEAPGKTEDARGIQFIGESGQLLRQRLGKLKLDLDRDFWKINAVNCWPRTKRGTNRTPTDREVKLCHPKVMEAINIVKPNAIWLMGAKAVQTYMLTKPGANKIKIGTLQGFHIPDRDLGMWVCPMYHPSYLIRSPKDKALSNLFDRSLEAALKVSTKKCPQHKLNDKMIKRLTNPEDIAGLLRRVLAMEFPPTMAFDYETTGLKPEARGHRILSVSACFDRNEAFSFLFDIGWKEVVDLWCKILRTRDFVKIAHNMKFEHRWSRVKLGVEVTGWGWDTMLAAHILDGRPGISGLKMQTFLNYGIWGYEEAISPYIDAAPADKAEHGGNAFNRMDQCPQDDLLLYGGYDALFTYRLAQDQQKKIRTDKGRAGIDFTMQDAYHLFHHGALALADAEAAGIHVDEDYYVAKQQETIEQIKKTKQALQRTKPARLWKEKTGSDINPSSNPQLSKLLFEMMGAKPVKETAKGKASTDEESLKTLAEKDRRVALFLNTTLKLRKLSKLEGTYLGGIRREAVEGFIHPSFNLHLARTYRSSSDSPNFQNVPARDEKSKELIRRGIIARPGCHLVEVDYSGIEVRIAACYTQDPTLIAYIKDPATDMHRDQAMDCYKLTLKQVTKWLRYSAKNKFVFPEFYGSWWKNCAASLWEVAAGSELADGTPFMEHVKSVGLHPYSRFERHIERVEHRFWKKYAGYAAWKDRWVRQYEKHGYVPMMHGFRRTDLLNRNQILNSSIQGTAFHCLLWSLIRLNQIRREEQWDTLIVGQIHDSIVMDVPTEELDMVLPITNRVMCKDILESHPWIIVPLDIEAEVTPINGSWVDKKEVQIAA